jgi:hypothetical protein
MVVMNRVVTNYRRPRCGQSAQNLTAVHLLLDSRGVYGYAVSLTGPAFMKQTGSPGYGVNPREEI